ncbi:TolC family protein [Piscinibacter koreensis]|uniref:TolC family protein n=1 Tax=Piscinibacter koreensis TaxID=2742824 RepID=A0A7Y6TZG0_9BURK|nr:TolC family protein [Schlegelella koreensis]NUZ09081.1 TolC family protein [Schlegelella koreensis]
MGFKTLAALATLWVSSAIQAQPLTLLEAMRRAETASPNVLARQTQLAAVEGLQRQAARPLFGNPELTVEGARRRAAGVNGSATEYAVGLAQPLELGGQQARRREAAGAAVEALRAEIQDARRQARADAATRFHAIVAAERRVLLERRSTELFDSVSQAVERRRAAGEDTRLDANVAVVEAERSRNALAAAGEQLLDARSDLATLLQTSPAQLPEIVPESLESAVAEMDIGALDLSGLLQAVTDLPRLRALAAREAAARARLGVERANQIPGVTIGVSTGREGFRDGRERLTTLSVSVPLPLWNRNEAAIGQALTDVAQAELERQTGIRAAEANVRRLWLRLQSQRERVLRLQRSLLPASASNQQLAARSRQAGQIGLLDQVVVNRQALDAERELNEALSEAAATRIELENAAGRPIQGLAP